MIISRANSTILLLDTPACISHNCVERICKAIRDLAIQVFKAICNCFGGSEGPTPVSKLRVSGPLNLISFYRGQEANNNHVTLQQILAWDDTLLESVHDYIQWLFPLKNS